MKRFLSVVLLVGMFGVGCESDSHKDAGVDQFSPLGPTRTFDVPGTYRTIQDAINAAGAGDFVRVAAGVYPENLLIKSKSLGLRGAGKGLTIIQGSVIVENSSNTSFEGFTVKGGMHVKNSAIRIVGNEILESPIAGLWLESCLDVAITDNEIRNNGREGILIDDSSGVLIGSTIVTYNATEGMVINNSSPTLTGDRILFNQRDGIVVRGMTFQSSPFLLENIAQDNGGVSNYDIICIGRNANPTGVGNLFVRCLNCVECRSFGNPVTYRDSY
jgi:parallel beta-helix repeat protein